MTTKNIKIKEEIHTKLKSDCAIHHCLLSEWVEEIIKLYYDSPVLVNLLRMSQDLSYIQYQINRTEDKEEIKKFKKQLSLLQEQYKVYHDIHFPKS